jgi:NADPH-dependent glutamate synthase beta subunit-like oxidoreductase
VLTCQSVPDFPSEAVGRCATLQADTIIIAVERDNTVNLNVKSDEGIIDMGKGLFSAGNVVTGKVSFIESIAAGKNAAKHIDIYLGGNGDICERLAPVTKEIPRIGRMPNFSQRKRNGIPCLATVKRLNNFNQIELGFDQELGSAEADRCMGCDLRFHIAHMISNVNIDRPASTVNM